MQLAQRLKPAIEWVLQLRPVRVFMHYAEKLGPLLSSGLSYQAIFAVFAAIWVGFAVAGFIVQGDPVLLEAVYNFISTNIPGLIGDGSGNGAITRETLADTNILGITGVIAAFGLAFTALGWIASGRSAVRSMFGLESSETNFLILKLKDAGLAIGFGLAVLVSAGVSVLSSAALNWILGLVSIGEDSTAGLIATRGVALVIVLILDTATLGIFYRVISGIKIPFRILAQGTIIAAVALGALKFGGGFLLEGATRNPLLASFAVIIGLLIWFNFICQIILIGAGWIAVAADDADLDISGEKRADDAPRAVTATKAADDAKANKAAKSGQKASKKSSRSPEATPEEQGELDKANEVKFKRTFKRMMKRNNKR
ncbi:YihY/virulence factor BrkB family protein [Salinibacterium sp. UTAS2018]|uniref:YihY/virulence factor BrkB family protein n=1 Tax=Salinibacterium sp. UTAS2018 TaxID=2508880 RepID=UPI0010097E86|nr:YihY/virulence factor BrkB family protein [Salinibacterium sp. UTAS2018]QAV71193.1 YihY/virulence factor BrkB family protein [Salinibacterium sp. UTAS2018]